MDTPLSIAALLSMGEARASKKCKKSRNEETHESNDRKKHTRGEEEDRHKLKKRSSKEEGKRSSKEDRHKPKKRDKKEKTYQTLGFSVGGSADGFVAGGRRGRAVRRPKTGIRDPYWTDWRPLLFVPGPSREDPLKTVKI